MDNATKIISEANFHSHDHEELKTFGSLLYYKRNKPLKLNSCLRKYFKIHHMMEQE